MNPYCVTYNVVGGALAAVTLPLWLPYMLCKRKYRASFMRRAGVIEPGQVTRLRAGRNIWIHAVSVGEFNLAATLIEQLRPHCDGYQFLVTVTTVTGYELARTRLRPEDVLLFFPFDAWPLMNRLVKLANPRVTIVVETELWPNFIYALDRHGSPCVVVNGRISQKSYRRYTLALPFMRDMLGRIRQFNMQTPRDAERITALGAPPDRVHVGGNIKFDAAQLRERAEPDADLATELRMPPDTPLLLAAALDRTGEEDPVMLDVLARLRQDEPRAALLIVPRHPERGEAIAQLVAARGYVPRRRSRGETFADPMREVYILDTIGELKRFYTLARTVFVGKSLFAPGGGQNMLEPVALGVPTVYGPYTSNFRGVADVLLEHDGARLVRTADELALAVLALWRDPADARAMVARGQAFVRSQQGATARSVQAITSVLDTAF